MTWLALKLLGFAGWLKESLSACFRWLWAHPREAAILALLALFLWTLHGKRTAIADRAAALTELQRVIDAGKQAHEAQLAANKAFQDKSRIIATGVQHDHETALGRNLAAGDLYAASHRVRCPASPSGNGDPAAQGDPAGLSADAAADTFVAVSEPDLKICTADYTYAQSAHELAKQLVAAGVAEWGQ